MSNDCYLCSSKFLSAKCRGILLFCRFFNKQVIKFKGSANSDRFPELGIQGDFSKFSYMLEFRQLSEVIEFSQTRLSDYAKNICKSRMSIKSLLSPIYRTPVQPL